MPKPRQKLLTAFETLAKAGGAGLAGSAGSAAEGSFKTDQLSDTISLFIPPASLLAPAAEPAGKED